MVFACTRKDGESPLHFADNVQVAEALLEGGASSEVSLPRTMLSKGAESGGGKGVQGSEVTRKKLYTICDPFSP